MTYEELKQLTAFARLDGLRMGLLWVGSFAGFLLGFESQPLMLLCLLLSLFTPILAAIRLRKFRDNIRYGHISFRRAMAYLLLIFFYGSLIVGAVLFIYFTFIDHGFLYTQLSKVYSSPEMQPMLRQLGMTTQQVLTLYRAYRPIDFALQCISSSLLFGVIIATPIALIMKRKAIIH